MRIRIIDYDPDWPRRFEQEARRIRRALGERALRIEHVGSTSVPDLPAKPVIDIVLVVADSSRETDYSGALESAGYQLRIREPEWHEHRMFKGPRDCANLHVFSDGCLEVDRMLTFRDWLRGNRPDRDWYAQAKRNLARQEWTSVDAYAQAKTGVIQEIMSRAQMASGARAAPTTYAARTEPRQDARQPRR